MHKRVCQNNDFCNVIRSSEDTYISEFNKNKKFDKAPFIIYADLECIIEKIDGCKNNPEHWSSTEVSEDIPSGFSVSITSLFRSIDLFQKLLYDGSSRFKQTKSPWCWSKSNTVNQF